MIDISQIKMEVNLTKAGKFELTLLETKECEDKVIYVFNNDEHKIKANFTLDEKDNITTGSIDLMIQNELFRENDNLALVKPIVITLKLKEQAEAITAMYLYRDWWTRPSFISSFKDIPDRTQSLYLKYKNSNKYLLPIACNEYKSLIEGKEDNSLTINMTAYMGGMNKVNETVFILTEAENIYTAIEKAFNVVSSLKQIPKKNSKQYPAIFEYLGWCSWDAFYTDITEEKIKAKAFELKEKQIPVRWFLIDDGWLSVHNQQLYSFKPEVNKFPNGFKQMIEDIKAETNINWFGVWHAFGGYWGGVEPNSELANLESSNLYTTTNGKCLPYPTKELGYRFFRNWYEYLKSEGINFVKVDGQSAIKNYYENNQPVCKVAKETHKALEEAVSAYMGGNLINCMGMSMENILSRNSAMSRNSDDFVPDNENSFSEHLLQNTYNSLYHDELYYCDFDMFWTNHKDAIKHGLLRAISGGPIYFSDKLNDTNLKTIEPLIYKDGSIIRMSRTAKPSIDCIFNNPLENGVIKLTNIYKQNGAIAVYNISNEDFNTTISPKDIYDLNKETFFVYNYFTKEYKILDWDEEFNINVPINGYQLYLLVPYKKQTTMIGLIDKYISFHAIEEIKETKERTIVILKQSGTIAFYKETPINKLLINGEVTTYELKPNNLYEVNCEGDGKVIVTIE